jgi:hypothetical protein
MVCLQRILFYEQILFAAGGIKKKEMEMLSKVWQGWKRIAQAIGDFIGRIVLTVFYFTLFAPFGLGMRFFGDPLVIKPVKNKVGWETRSTRDRTLDDLQRLF